MATPTVEPVTIPVADPIAAIADVLLLQVPPVVALVSVVVLPRHTVFDPPITSGKGLTVTVAVAVVEAIHPGAAAVAVYVFTVAAVPAAGGAA
jgi:hypothetical protein